MAFDKQPKNEIDLAAAEMLKGKKVEKVEEIKPTRERFNFKELNEAAEACLKELKSKEVPTFPETPPEIIEKKKDVIIGAQTGIEIVQGKISYAGVNDAKRKKMENLFTGMQLRKKQTGPRPLSRFERESAATTEMSKQMYKSQRL